MRLANLRTTTPTSAERDQRPRVTMLRRKFCLIWEREGTASPLTQSFPYEGPGRSVWNGKTRCSGLEWPA